MGLWLTYFELICNLTVLLLIIFTALSYATGLFYLAELAEEFPTLTRRCIVGLLVALCALHVLGFVFSPLSKTALLLGLLTHASYYRLMSNFPYLPLTSPIFFLSLALLAASQVWWYIQLNSQPTTAPYSSYSRYNPPSYQYNAGPQYSPAQQMAFFFLFVWLLPLVFFIAGSVSSQSLPQMGDRLRGDDEDSGEKKGHKASRFSLSSLKRFITRDKSDSRDSHAPTARTGDALTNGGGEDYGRHYDDGVRGADGVGSHVHHAQAHAQPPWYPAGGGGQVGGPTAAAESSEGEWMGQGPLPPRPVYNVRQRSHLN